MSNEYALQKLLASNGGIDTVADLLDVYLDKEVYDEMEHTMEVARADGWKDEIICNLMAEVACNAEMKAFYLGVDYTLNLLGRDGILDFLPEQFKLEVKE